MHPLKIVAAAALLVGFFVLDTDAFSLPQILPRRGRSSTRLRGFSDSFLDTISGSLPSFGPRQEEPPSSSFPPLPPPPFQPTPEGVIQRAKLLLACDLGVQDESLLDPNFIWIGASLGSKVLGKTDYLAAGKFFDLRSVFPDLDYRAHDFRIDIDDPMTIRFTTRVVGTMRGELRLRNEVLPPNGKQMRCPPEAITMTFDERTGSLKKLCSGFTMDRLVGNTDGLCGVMGAATVAGKPPSDWEVYPVPQVIARFFGRPTQQQEEPASYLAPFPETVMVQLAKGIFSANMAEADGDLLSPSFQYYTPYDGPVDKNKYLADYASQIFDGLEPELTYLRVDPYDPYRVWVDVKPSGVTTSGVYVDAPPQAFSFTFDDEGFCTRLTASAVMDPSIGNTGGLTGIEGEKYAAGKASPGISTRPYPQALERLRKRISEPFTKVGVDDYTLIPGAPVIIRPSALTTGPVSPVEKLKQQKPTPPAQKPTIVTPPKIVKPETKVKQAAPEPPAKRPTLTIPTLSIPTPAKPASTGLSEAEKKAQAAREKKEQAAREKKEAQEAARAARLEALEAQKQEAARIAAEQEEAARRRKEEIEQAKLELEAERERRAQEEEAARQAKAAELEAAKKKMAAEQAAIAKRKAEEAEANRIARAAVIEAEAKRKAQLAAEAASRKAQAQVVAIESRRKATEAEAAQRAKAQAAEIEARRKAQIANQKALAAKQKADEVKRAQEAEEKRKRQEQLAVEREAERRREEREAAALQREREAAARVAEKEREAAAEVERQRQEKLAAEKQAMKDKKAREAAALKQAQEEAAALTRERKERLAAERQAEKERKEREAERLKQERKRKAQLAAEKQLERVRKIQQAQAAKKAKAAALEAERARQAEIAAEKKRAQSSEQPSPARPSVSLFGLGGSPAPAPKPAPSKAAPAPRSTFSLSSVFGSSSDTEERAKSSPPAAKSTPRATTSAPPGVPVISGWKQNFDGSISGRITGSSAFGSGEKVTTSPIRGKAVGGSVVQTSSGSRYYLEAKGSASPAPSPRPSISLFGLGGDGESRPSKSVPKPRPSKQIPKPRPSKQIPKPRPSKQIPKATPAQIPRSTVSLFGLGGTSSSRSVPVPKPRPSKSVPNPRPSKSVPKPRPSKQVPKATATQSPRSTISLFGLGGGDSSSSKSVPVPKAATKKAPRGVPTLSRWNKNRDGSVTGRITGSNQFGKNEKVTTSPIASGEFKSGSIVRTTSGSRYFLA